MGEPSFAFERRSSSFFKCYGEASLLLVHCVHGRNKLELGRIRTVDPLVKSQLLYRLSYEPECNSERYLGNTSRLYLPITAGETNSAVINNTGWIISRELEPKYIWDSQKLSICRSSLS